MVSLDAAQGQLSTCQTKNGGEEDQDPPGDTPSEGVPGSNENISDILNFLSTHYANNKLQETII